LTLMESQYLVGFNLSELPLRHTDVLVIGGGIAGLTVALTVADKLKVQVLTKGEVKQTSTWHAQGGFAASIAPQDSPDLHFKDTMVAGAGLSDPQAVKVLVEEAADAVSMLIEFGTVFDQDRQAELLLGLEGGHSVARVLHAGDATGSAIAAALSEKTLRHPNVSMDQNVFVLDLLVQGGRCFGVLVYDALSGGLAAYQASAVVLAAGGMGQIYEITTNPPAATGDGQAMAYRKGVELADMEFVQFHPTALALPSNPRFLISEAVRGEGAHLVDAQGQRFMVGRHPLAELAPRDIVCQGVVRAMREDQAEHVYLDARHIPADLLRTRFPVIWKECRKHALDLSASLIPVAPAAHYLIGGIKTDLQGRTGMPGLLAGGEVASTGVHGANRLASNSLLEGVVFSRRIGRLLTETVEPGDSRSFKASVKVPRRPGGPSPAPLRSRLRSLMSEKAGVIRTTEDLTAASEQLALWLESARFEHGEPADWETINMLTVARLIVARALARRRSVGAHLVTGSEQ
jgi:L-aspartate oxidase